ncbi:SusC/RagA family TonB-linked outer membrane protein [Mariniflexile rhizosphaerae]|uniref:SusC/RagA family TonB-linked outer membrane protein n=1 Tax=unclassified Mariniflexile TaxID=2643887 RepID=UPI000CAA8571|nr:TonB-dependent receptor [Mariniflexile sp. TRM1-10]PLB19831.1 MAG: SusC, outer membrane protein involved in starch binding [Flavobacteriaceae bacterium FS1-H7996/R]
MRTFFFLLCTTVFSFTTENTFSQEKVVIDQDQTVTVDKVFKIIKEQTNYRFIYPSNLFENAPKIQLTKGEIEIQKLLNQSLSGSNLNFEVSKNNTIVIKENVVNYVNEIQQGIQISGTVVDGSGFPLPGANILEQGTKNGAQSDFDGNFSLKVSSKNAVLVVSYLGYLTREVALEGKTKIDIVLRENASALDEVVVVGYGTQRKSDLTGSVSVVDIDNAKKTVTYDAAKMLQGQVAGVTVQSSGEPGGFVNIKIRGINSFSNNNPLFVIDGMIIDSPFDFAPGDIESMQVLKDASAAAIYGVRGANGVVIITTKKGKMGKFDVKLKSLYGVQNVANTWSVTDRVGYQNITTAAELNAGLSIAPGNDPNNPSYISNVDTNWQEAAFRTGYIENHALTFSGGAESLAYNMNVDYFKNSSYMDSPQDYERISTNLNLTGNKGKFKYGSKLGYTQSNKEIFNEYLAGQSPISDLLGAIPTMSVYDENNIGGYGGTDNLTQRAISMNVIGFNNVNENSGQRNRFIGNIWGELEIFEGFKYKLDASFDRLDWKNRLFIPESELGWYYLTTPEEASLDIATGSQTRTFLNHLLTYDITLADKHKIGVLAGLVQERNDYYNHWSRGVGYPTGTISHLEYATDTSTGENENTITGISYLSRLNYGYDDRYLLTVNFRQDKTSLFSEINNSANFYSFSGAWKLSNEKFITLPEWLNTVKLRGGYGELGNNTIPPYFFATTTNQFAGYNFNNALAPGTTVVSSLDPNVHWEKTKTTNVALELGLLDNDLQFTAEYYIKKSNDLLIGVPLPFSTGAFPASITTNAGAVQNKGLEFTASYSNNRHEFKYNISANLGTLKNEVQQIGINGNPIYGAASKTEVGRSIGEIYAYETDGIFQSDAEVAASPTQVGAAAGDIKFKDQLTVDTDNDGVFDSADGIINDQDRIFQGVTIPKYSYGFNFNSTYKNFDLSFFLQGAGGNKAFNGMYRNLMIGQYVNHHTDALNYWTPTNTDTNVPRPIIGDPNGNARDSNRFIEDGDYIKLQNMEIGYNIPLGDNKLIQSVRIYANGQNLFIISKYRGYDPDFNSNDGLFSRGYDGGSLPNPRTFSLGVQVDF